jgi:type I restriction enzyme, S subunit
MKSLPIGWSETRLDTVAEWGSGGTPKAGTASYYGGGIPWAVIGDLDDGSVSTTARTITDAGLSNSSAKIVGDDVVLVAMYGSIGKLGLPTIPMATNQAIAFAKPRSGVVNRRYLFYYLMHARHALTRVGKGATQQNISQTILKAWPIRLPPLAEQERIVAAIEEQFSRLDAGVTALERVRQNLKRMRAAVLHAAVSGRLIPLDPAGALARDELALLVDKRRFTKGLQPPILEHQELPSTWATAYVEDLAERVTVGYVGPMQTEYVSAGIPFLRSQNVRANRFDADGLKFVSSAFHQRIIKSRLLPGDVVVVRSGSVGTACVIPDALGEANCSDLVVIQRPRGMNPHFLAYYMNSMAQRYVRAGQVGVALTHFNTKSVAALPIPVPPIEEQHEIVAETDRQLSIIDQLEMTLCSLNGRSSQARSSILAAAFSGKLVPQDPSDEPASVLLERIDERALSNGHKPTRARSQRRRKATA